MAKHKKHASSNRDAHLESAVKKASLAEKDAQKLVKETLSEMGVNPTGYGAENPPPAPVEETDIIMATAHLAEQRAERLVQRTLSQLGR